MEYLAPGNSRVTAWAITWAVEWRNTWRPSSVASVTIATFDPSCSGRVRSVSEPSTTAATADLASPRPIELARSSEVLPSGSSRGEPSGRVTVMFDMPRRVYEDQVFGRSGVLRRLVAEAQEASVASWRCSATDSSLTVATLAVSASSVSGCPAYTFL